MECRCLLDVCSSTYNNCCVCNLCWSTACAPFHDWKLWNSTHFIVASTTTSNGEQLLQLDSQLCDSVVSISWLPEVISLVWLNHCRVCSLKVKQWVASLWKQKIVGNYYRYCQVIIQCSNWKYVEELLWKVEVIKEVPTNKVRKIYGKFIIFKVHKVVQVALMVQL